MTAFEAYQAYESAQMRMQAAGLRNTHGMTAEERFKASSEYELASREAWKAYCAYQDALGGSQ